MPPYTVVCQLADCCSYVLIVLPAGEETRWTMQSKEFDSQIQRLTGDCAVASAFVSYLGPFNKEFRELLMSRDFYGDCIKLNIPVTHNIEASLVVALMGLGCTGNVLPGVVCSWAPAVWKAALAVAQWVKPPALPPLRLCVPCICHPQRVRAGDQVPG